MMTTAQLATFRTAITGNSSLTAAVSAGAHGEIVAHYSQPGTGTIWRPEITVKELNTAIVWSEYAALTVALQNTYRALIAPGFIDATSANIRGGFSTIFGAATASRANLLAIAQRVPTRFEALYTSAQVCSMFGRSPSVADVVDALR